MGKKLVLFSGGMDSTAIMLEYIEQYGAKNIIGMGINYGQRHFERENAGAVAFCEKRKIPRPVLNVPISQIGGCSLIDKNIEVTTDMTKQRSTVVPQRNAIFLLFAAAFAQENDCDTVVHGAIKEDFEAYRDCRPEFFESIEKTIQLGRTNPKLGPEYDEELLNSSGWGYSKFKRRNIDIKIETPLINENKADTVKRILAKYGIKAYEDSYTCYNGVDPSCGQCPACAERIAAFKANGRKDTREYAVDIDWK